MTSESIAALRKSQGEEYAQLAEQHLKHDLTDADRSILQASAKTVSLWATVGSVAGVSLGFLLAYRLRAGRTAMFRAIRAADQPTHITFAGGRTEELPDLRPYMKPSRLGDFATYFFMGTAGLFLGGELGLLGGSARATGLITKDPESKARIETAFRKFRADMLRKQADNLDSGTTGLGSVRL